MLTGVYGVSCDWGSGDSNTSETTQAPVSQCFIMPAWSSSRGLLLNIVKWKLCITLEKKEKLLSLKCPIESNVLTSSIKNRVVADIFLLPTKIVPFSLLTIPFRPQLTNPR